VFNLVSSTGAAGKRETFRGPLPLKPAAGTGVNLATPYKSFTMMLRKRPPRLHPRFGCGRERLAWWAAPGADSRNQHAAV